MSPVIHGPWMWTEKFSNRPQKLCPSALYKHWVFLSKKNKNKKQYLLRDDSEDQPRPGQSRITNKQKSKTTLKQTKTYLAMAYRAVQSGFLQMFGMPHCSYKKK